MHILMRSVFALGGLLAMSTDTPAQMPPPGMPPHGPMMGTLLTVQAEAEVRVAPDVATLSTGVVTTAATGKEALAQNAQRMNAMLTGLKAAGVADRDIQTSGISLQPQYVYNTNEAPKLTGYQASNAVNVTVRKLDQVGSVMDSMASRGASNLNGPNFTVDNPEPLLDEARTLAVKKAITRANLYARAASMKVKRIVAIAEGSVQRAEPVMQMQMRSAAKSSDETPVEAGRISQPASVTMTFELEP